LIGGLVARMTGYEFEVPCDCFELSLEVVERSIVSLNSFTSLEETVSGFVGGGFAFVTISVAPLTPISCFLSKSLFPYLLHWSSIAEQKDVMKITLDRPEMTHRAA
jgi:hypothetical protein